MRITTARTGKGDSGYSEVIAGNVIPKSSDILIAQNYTQLVMILTSKLLLQYSDLLDSEDISLLQQLKVKEANNLGAAIYYRLSPEYDQYIPTEFANKLGERIVYFKQQLVHAPEFTLCADLVQCDFMLLSTMVRFLEVYLWKEVFDLYVLPDNAPTATKQITSTYNALSDYIYQLNRYIASKSNNEQYWDKSVEYV